MGVQSPWRPCRQLRQRFGTKAQWSFRMFRVERCAIWPLQVILEPSQNRTGEMTSDVCACGGGGRDQSFHEPDVFPPKTENSSDFAHYFFRKGPDLTNKKSNKIFFSLPGGQTFRGPRWPSPKQEKITGFDPLFFERGPLSKHVGSPRSPEGIGIFGPGEWSSTVPHGFSSPVQNPKKIAFSTGVTFRS